jgi:hypothetical protein
MCYSSNLPGFDSSTLNTMVLYYRLMTKLSGLGDSTKLSWVGLSQVLARVTSEVNKVTSRLGLRDPVDSGIKCRPYGLRRPR